MDNKIKAAKAFYHLLDLGYRPMEAFCVTTLISGIDSETAMYVLGIADRLCKDTANTE